MHHAAARSLGLLGARSSELLGTAVGAVGAASAAASRFLVQGAVAGASSAWQASRLQEAPSRLEVQLPPRPAALPAPLPAVPPPTPGTIIVSEDTGAIAVAEAERKAAERHRELEARIEQLTALVTAQNAQHERQLRERDAQILALRAAAAASSEVSAKEFDDDGLAEPVRARLPEPPIEPHGLGGDARAAVEHAARVPVFRDDFVDTDLVLSLIHI